MKPLGPVDTVQVFDDERAVLLDVLASLPRERWDLPTVCAGWSVKDIAAHLIADDLGVVSSGRDGHRNRFDGPWEELLAFINAQNEAWVAVMRRVSPPLVLDLLRLSGPQLSSHIRTLDLDATGAPVDWAGPGPASVWLDVAREYTEHWLHSQQIYDALGVTRARERRLFAPVLDTFVRALPHTYRNVDAPPGTHVRLVITGDSGGAWSLIRGDDVHRGDPETRSSDFGTSTTDVAQPPLEESPGRPAVSPWSLYADADAPPTATVTLDQETAWRTFTRGVDRAAAREQARIEGDVGLGEVVLRAVAIIA